MNLKKATRPGSFLMDPGSSGSSSTNNHSVYMDYENCLVTTASPHANIGNLTKSNKLLLLVLYTLVGLLSKVLARISMEILVLVCICLCWVIGGWR
jgi:hypothetical protein